MAFNDVITTAKQYFPNLKIAYKDQSPLMKFLGKLLFFNPAFMSNFITTLNDTVYFPSQNWITNNQQAAIDVFIHECVHMYDEKRLGFFYQLGYVFPQVLLLPAIILFAFSWKLALLAMVVCLLPLPAPWRTYFEKRAYFVQSYVLSKVWGVKDVSKDALVYNGFFSTGAYYWMWPWGLDGQFLQAASEINAGVDPLKDDVMLMVDALIGAARK